MVLNAIVGTIAGVLGGLYFSASLDTVYAALVGLGIFFLALMGVAIFFGD